MPLDISIDKWVDQYGMPTITTDDGRLRFLIDTGATFNVLLQDAFDRCKPMFGKVGRDDMIIGMDGEPQKIFLVRGDICFDAHHFDAEFGVMEMTEALHTVRVLTGLRIDGALGVDFFLRHNLCIDFAHLRVTD